MKVLCILAAAIAVTSAVSTNEELWRAYKQTHGKQYRGLLEEKLRYEIFQSNLQKIEEHNAKFTSGKTKFTMGINQFADLTHEEFVSMLNTHPKPTKTKGLEFNTSSISALESIDWRTLGAVTPVKDQGSCGSCWSFSATGALEGQVHKATNQLISFSEQALVDCSGAYGNEGCQGGYMDLAFQFIKENGLPSEEDYPYLGVDEECRNYTKAIVTISGYADVKENDEQGLVNAVSAIGPVSVAVDATYFQFYQSGLYDYDLCSPEELNHGVVAVGYDSVDGEDYWIVKNSWGASWGENGYIRMLRGVNLCGIATNASYPLLYC